MRLRHLSATLVMALVIVGCGGDDSESAGDVALDGESTAEPTPDDTGDTDDTADPAGADPVDTTTAEPGTWPVGDAGTVTFAVEDGRPRLVDHAAADGWEATVETEDDDELAVEFRREGEAWDLDVDIADGALEVELQHDLRDAEPGTFDLPDGGSFAVESDGSTVAPSSVTPGDGWEVTEQEQDDDSFAFTATRGDRRVEVEVETDDGRIEAEIDYRVRGDLPA